MKFIWQINYDIFSFSVLPKCYTISQKILLYEYKNTYGSTWYIIYFYFTINTYNVPPQRAGNYLV
jgi:hypothetical protein